MAGIHGLQDGSSMAYLHSIGVPSIVEKQRCHLEAPIWHRSLHPEFSWYPFPFTCSENCDA